MKEFKPNQKPTLVGPHMQFGQQDLDKGRRRVSAVRQNHYTIFSI